MKNKIKKSDLPGSFQDVVEHIGFDASLKLIDLCGGQSLYIPKKESCQLQARKRSILELWERGDVTFMQLAKKFDYSESHIRQIVREERSKRFCSGNQKEFLL